MVVLMVVAVMVVVMVVANAIESWSSICLFCFNIVVNYSYIFVVFLEGMACWFSFTSPLFIYLF
jgi:hypothetical protein